MGKQPTTTKGGPGAQPAKTEPADNAAKIEKAESQMPSHDELTEQTAERIAEHDVGAVAERPKAALLSPEAEKAQNLAMLAEMGDVGFEHVAGGDLAMPFFKLLHSMTPECQRDSGSYVKGARQGMYFDTISKKLYRSLIVAPCKYVTHYIEWWPRDSKKGEGLEANHGSNPDILSHTHRDEETGRDMTDRGTYIVATGTWFFIVLKGEEFTGDVIDDEPQFEWRDSGRPGVYPMSGTQMKACRRWVSDSASIEMRNAEGKLFRPPMFAMTFELGSQPTKNDQGTWALATVDRAGWLLDYEDGGHLLTKCKEFAKLANENHMAIARQQTTDENDAKAAGARPMDDRDGDRGRGRDDRGRDDRGRRDSRDRGRDDDERNRRGPDDEIPF